MKKLTKAQKNKIWIRILNKAGEEYTKAYQWGNFWRNTANLCLSICLLVFIIVCTYLQFNGYFIIPRKEIDIQLQVKSITARDNNSLVISKADGSQEIISASNYKIEDNTLKINLPVGKYRIILISDKYQTYSATAQVFQ